MIAKSDPLLLALLSWAYWAADLSLIKKLEAQAALPAEYSSGEVGWLIERIAAGLYYPPSQDAFGVSSIYERNWVDQLYVELAEKLSINPAPFWPYASSAALIMSHDIDRTRTTYQHLPAAFRHSGLTGLLLAGVKGRPSGPDPFKNFAEIEQVEKRWGVASTFFVLNERPRYKQLLYGQLQHVFGVYDPAEIAESLKQCLQRGCEIGLHLSFDSYYDESAFNRERNYIERCVQSSLAGARSHYLNFDDRTIDILLSAGIEYDSSMGFNFIPGFRCGTAFPFVIGKDDATLLWEIPLHLMDTSLMWQMAKCNLGWPECAAAARRIADTAYRCGGLLCFNIHQRFFNTRSQPQLLELLDDIVGFWKEKGVWMPTLSDLTAWWKQRPSIATSEPRTQTRDA